MFPWAEASAPFLRNIPKMCVRFFFINRDICYFIFLPSCAGAGGQCCRRRGLRDRRRREDLPLGLGGQPDSDGDGAYGRSRTVPERARPRQQLLGEYDARSFTHFVPTIGYTYSDWLIDQYLFFNEGWRSYEVDGSTFVVALEASRETLLTTLRWHQRLAYIGVLTSL